MKLLFFSTLLSSILLFGCHPFYLRNNNLSKITKNITQEELESIICEKPEYVGELSYEDKKYNVAVYSYLKEIQMYGSFSETPPYVSSSYNLVKYIFLFRNGHLHYWGTPTDFSKSGDDDLEVLTESLFQLERVLPNTAFTP